MQCSLHIARFPGSDAGRSAGTSAPQLFLQQLSIFFSSAIVCACVARRDADGLVNHECTHVSCSRTLLVHYVQDVMMYMRMAHDCRRVLQSCCLLPMCLCAMAMCHVLLASRCTGEHDVHGRACMHELALSLKFGCSRASHCASRHCHERFILVTLTTATVAVSMSLPLPKTETTPIGVGGALAEKEPGSDLGFDLYDPQISIEFLFGSLSGAALLEAILKWYQDTEMDVPWFSDAPEGPVRNVVRSPLSRDLQECTVAAYAERIKEEGLSQIVAGREVCGSVGACVRAVRMYIVYNIATGHQQL